MTESQQHESLEAILSYAVISIALRKIFDDGWPDRRRLGLQLRFGYSSELVSFVGVRIAACP